MVEGQNYIPQGRLFIVQIAQVVMWTTLAVLAFGNHLFALLNIRPPEFYRQIQENQVGLWEVE